jgi:hypothetical protein
MIASPLSQILDHSGNKARPSSVFSDIAGKNGLAAVDGHCTDQTF